MRMTRNSQRLGLAGLLATTALGFGLSASAQQVTYDRLVKAKVEPQNWLMRHGSYDAHNSSGLSQINRANVANLKVKFMASLNHPTKPMQSMYWTPLVNEGSMYAGNGWHQIWKFDLRGDKPQIVWFRDLQQEVPHITAQGGALLGNNFYVNTGTPGRLISLDTATGETVYEVSTVIPDVLKDQGHSAPPLAIKDKILIGNARGDWGNRGYVAAYSADRGKLLWKFLTVPNPGQPGHETWVDGWSYEQGGGAVWTLGTYDPDLNVAYFGTGNPVHMFDPQGHPGDNLYTNSTIALDVETGKLKWYFQETPNESWDYDAVAIRTLYDVEIDGTTRKVVGVTSRNGFFYANDRNTGQFLLGKPWTEVNWTAGLDPKTGKHLEYNAKQGVQDYAGRATAMGRKAMNIRPAHYGAPTMMPNHYDASRKILYFQSMVGAANYFNTRTADNAANTVGAGGREVFCAVHKKENAFEDVVRNKTNPNCVASYGLLAGIDVTTGKIVKEVRTPYPAYSGVLGTAGSLLFHGDQNGKLMAYDKDTMAELWSFDSGMRYSGTPISYMVGGKQYIVYNVGGGSIQRDEGTHPETYLIGRDNLLIFFAL